MKETAIMFFVAVYALLVVGGLALPLVMPLLCWTHLLDCEPVDDASFALPEVNVALLPYILGQDPRTLSHEERVAVTCGRRPPSAGRHRCEEARCPNDPGCDDCANEDGDCTEFLRLMAEHERNSRMCFALSPDVIE